MGCVWKFISGENLNGAHDFFVDVKAQTDVVVSKQFSSFIDKQQSIRNVADIFSKKQDGVAARAYASSPRALERTEARRALFLGT